MGGDDAGGEPLTDAAVQIAAQRATLIELLGELPETRLSKPTPRQGWTLRHELTWLAASDEELLQRLDPAPGAVTDEAGWRRIRGQAMHAAQELRLAALREHLESSGGRVSASLQTHSQRLGERAVRDAIALHVEHANAALDRLRTVLGR